MGKSKVEIIDETVEYINKNGRAIGEYENPFTGEPKLGCVYKSTNEEGETIGCAVGRVLLDDVYNPEMEGKTAADFRGEGKLDHIIQPEYRGHSIDFWTELQCLHDTGRFWNEDNKSLSAHGEHRVKMLKEEFKE